MNGAIYGIASGSNMGLTCPHGTVAWHTKRDEVP
jgi:hypothetical protein